MKLLTKTVLGLWLAALGLALVSGCRTAHGFGEDMENAGQKIQEKTSGD